MTSRAALAYWLGLMRLWRRYFRYEVEGLEHLLGHECRLAVGYHGRPLAWDLFLLGAALYEEHRTLPLALVHRSFEQDPFLRWLTEGLGWATGHGPAMEEAVRCGRHIILAPGGEQEGLRTLQTRYRVDWGDHMGYLRFALRRGVPIVPVGAAGVDDAYHGLLPPIPVGEGRQPLWLGAGPLGMFPWSPPFPVHIHQLVGPPIDTEGVDPDDPAQLRALHGRVQAAVQDLLDQARQRHAPCCRRGRLRALLSP